MRIPTKAQLKLLEADNQRWPKELKQVPMTEWIEWVRNTNRSKIIEVWRSTDFLLTIYQEKDGIERLSVNRTKYDTKTNRWAAGITWDDLQRLKEECGRGDKDAVEVYPASKDVINVANMRHLWVLPYNLDFIWRCEGGFS